MGVGIVSLSENLAYVLNISYNLTIKKSTIDFNPILPLFYLILILKRLAFYQTL